jgi:hypothetical protein
MILVWTGAVDSDFGNPNNYEQLLPDKTTLPALRAPWPGDEIYCSKAARNGYSGRIVDVSDDNRHTLGVDVYGDTTLARPRVSNVPEPPDAGSVQVPCDWCGDACWKRGLEPDPLPPGTAAACSGCALMRGTHQREMDMARRHRERFLKHGGK